MLALTGRCRVAVRLDALHRVRPVRRALDRARRAAARDAARADRLDRAAHALRRWRWLVSARASVGSIEWRECLVPALNSAGAG